MKYFEKTRQLGINIFNFKDVEHLIKEIAPVEKSNTIPTSSNKDTMKIVGSHHQKPVECCCRIGRSYPKSHYFKRQRVKEIINNL